MNERLPLIKSLCGGGFQYAASYMPQCTRLGTSPRTRFTSINSKARAQIAAYTKALKIGEWFAAKCFR